MSKTAIVLVLMWFTIQALCWGQLDSLCEKQQFDDGTIVNAFYFTDSVSIIARRFDGSSSPVGMEWGEINTVSRGDSFYPWPDSFYDPVEITVWEEEAGTGLPKYPPIWTTVVTPSDSPAVVRIYPPDTMLATTNYIFLGMRNHEYPDGAEGLCVDGHRDFADTYRSSNGGHTWSEYGAYGDWHIRACLTYPDAVEEGFETDLVSCKLFPAVPNPLQESTVIRYSLPVACRVNLSVYDVAGGLVACLVDGNQGPGVFRLQWGRKGQPNGIYFCSLQAGDYSNTRKMILLR
ncbi:MAG: T9SS type A sorting domain-containing protein [bacterium]